jgi:hypothetical protein
MITFIEKVLVILCAVIVTAAIAIGYLAVVNATHEVCSYTVSTDGVPATYCSEVRGM